jgi:hypothetical protein
MSWFSSTPIPTYYEDEKSPVTIDDYRLLREEMYQQMEILKNSEWIYADQGIPEVKFYKKQVEGYPIEMLRIETEVDGTPQEVSQFHDECTLEERLAFEPQIKHHEVLARFGDEVIIIYVIFKGMYPVADRDSVAFRATKVLSDGTYINLGHSINYSSKPIVSNPVRAKGKVAIYHYPVPGNPYRCRMAKYILTDPMGNIPKFAVALAHKKICESASRFAAFLEKKFGEMDRSVPLQPSLNEVSRTNEGGKNLLFEYLSDDDSFCSLESNEDDEFSIVDASQEIHRIPQTSSSTLTINPRSELQHISHPQPQAHSPKQQPLHQHLPHQYQQQHYQWKPQDSNTNKTIPPNEKIEKKIENSSGISDAIITKTLVEIQKSVASLQQQINRLERMQSRNSLLTHLFYFSWPIVVVVAYHYLRKKSMV